MAAMVKWLKSQKGVMGARHFVHNLQIETLCD